LHIIDQMLLPFTIVFSQNLQFLLHNRIIQVQIIQVLLFNLKIIILQIYYLPNQCQYRVQVFSLNLQIKLKKETETPEVKELRDWLGKFGLQSLLPALQSVGIKNMKLVKYIDAEDLEDLNILPFEKKVLLKEIQKLNQVGANI
jgi:hypothetical protein